MLVADALELREAGDEGGWAEWAARAEFLLRGRWEPGSGPVWTVKGVRPPYAILPDHAGAGVRGPGDGRPCSDCGRDTTPCTGVRGCVHEGRWEYYMVADVVWAEAQADRPARFLCIGCLEARLGWQLTGGDFALQIQPLEWDTPRLAARRG